LLASNTRFDSIAQFPFQQLGMAALLILFLMAATSHDFWLAALTAPVWKRIHMLAYAAYVLLVGHVVLGELQSEKGFVLSAIAAGGAALIVSLHLAAAIKEARVDLHHSAASGEFVDACAIEELVDNRAKVVSIAGERVAIFAYGDNVSVVSNVCQHQNGPLGEGRIVDGCITCPWHGFQYLPETGASPAPFTEKVPTFRCRIEHGRVLVDPRPLPAGTYVEPARRRQLMEATS
jgi:nitrite reductase/ring-hydroxylating ferredoxin subunit